MAENNGVAETQQQTQQKGYCTGNCMKCLPMQRQYCASQLAYSNMRMLELMQQTLTEMSEKIEAIQNNEASLFYPNTETAQEGDGA